MSLIEVARLNEQQRESLAAYGRQWGSVRRETAPGDRAAAEEGVGKAYVAAGLAPPRQIVWTDGPYEMARAWVRSRRSAGDNLRHVVIDMMRRRAEAAIDRAVGLSVRTALIEEPGLSRPQPFTMSIDEAVLRACESVRAPMRARLLDLVRLRSLRQPHNFASSSFGFHTTVSLGGLEYLHDVCGLRSQTRALAGLWQIAKNVSWMLPHEDICWLADRPDRLQIDANGRLHCADGAALRYRDGWSAYAWKGVIVPEWLIERREIISLRSINSAIDPQVRRCMIDIYTPARFIADGGACRVSQDETGILWRQRWRWEAWAAVEVINGSPEPDGTLKHYFLQVPATVRTAREGVAWTYGLPEQRYRPIVRT